MEDRGNNLMHIYGMQKWYDVENTEMLVSIRYDEHTRICYRIDRVITVVFIFFSNLSNVAEE